MKTDYLVLPFYKDIKQTSLKSSQSNNFSLRNRFKIYTAYDRLLPFICPITDVCDFTFKVTDFYGNVIVELFREQVKHQVYAIGTQHYVAYLGSQIPALELGECEVPYSVQIQDNHSEWFWAFDLANDYLKFELGNSIDFLEIPYSKGFKQSFYLDSSFGTAEPTTLTVSSKDQRGNISTTYQKLTENFDFYWHNTPAHFKQLISSMEVLDFIKISNQEQEIICQERQAKLKSKRNESSFNFFDLELTIPSQKLQEIGICEISKFEETSCFIEVSAPAVIVHSIGDVLVECDVTPIVIIDPVIEAELFFYANITY